MFTVAAAATGPAPSPANRSVLLFVTALVTALALSKTAAGVGLYWSLSSLFGAAQGWLVHRHVQRAAASLVESR
jgi:membrane protein insertase Oxa1/YidC/SpoIIIJ